MLVTFVCEVCQTEVSKHRSSKSKPKFCTVSCSNKGRILSREIKTKCSCGGYKNSAAKTCNTCAVLFRSSVTLAELKVKHTVNNYHSTIRSNARYHFNKPLACLVCGYALHVDICHIRAVQDFPMCATLAEVNALDNLVALCKNHHWEFDNGHLSLDGLNEVYCN